MKSPLLSRRYAKALFDATRGQADLTAIGAAATRSAAQLDRPRLTLPDLFDLLGGEPSSMEIRNLLSILLRRKRQGLLPEISDAYATVKEESQGIRRVGITSATPLDSQAQERLTVSLQKIINAKTVVLESRVDPDLVGGIMIRIGDKLIDGSVKSRLEELRHRF